MYCKKNKVIKYKINYFELKLDGGFFFLIIYLIKGL